MPSSIRRIQITPATEKDSGLVEELAKLAKSISEEANKLKKALNGDTSTVNKSELETLQALLKDDNVGTIKAINSQIVKLIKELGKFVKFDKKKSK